jgi:DNA-directed RNA polymerase subunit alpha
MSTLTCIESYINAEKNHFGSFLIEPLEIGQGITLGNALRRTLLSDLNGCCITGVRINDIKHEFAIIEGLREDILEIILNLKDIIFKSSFLFTEKNFPLKVKGFLNVRGPLIVTAGMFKLPKDTLKILNPNQYICTLVDTREVYMEIDIEKGKGYRLSDENRKQVINEELFPSSKGTTLSVDAVFMPIKKVNYKIKLIHDTKGNIKESLNLEITTNGSITPKRSIQESLKVLINLFYPLFITPFFLNVSSDYSKLTLKNSKKEEKIRFKKNKKDEKNEKI